MIKIYTDGSCLENPGNGGWAAIIIDDEKKTQIKGSKKILQTIKWSYLLQLKH